MAKKTLTVGLAVGLTTLSSYYQVHADSKVGVDKSQNETARAPQAEAKQEDLLPSDLLQISETDTFSRHVLLVDKSQRRISVFERNGAGILKVDEYPTDIGKNDGNKTKRDDHRTPEGIYFLEKKLSQPEIPFSTYGSMAFTTNYPNLFDRRENKTGSGIWLHAVPDTVPLTRGSRGCVVVRNEVIKKLGDYIKLRETPILIFDHVSYISKAEHEKRRLEMNSFVESWRQAWEAQDVEKYMGFYDPSFRAPGYDYAGWKNLKTSLKQKYEYIKVRLSQPYIILHNEQMIVKTLQKYESNQHEDYGVKTIYAMRTKDGYRIIREEWTPGKESMTTASSQDAALSK